MKVTEPIGTKKDVAARYSVTERCVEKWMSRGWLPHIKIGNKITRFDMQAVDDAVMRKWGRNQSKAAR